MKKRVISLAATAVLVFWSTFRLRQLHHLTTAQQQKRQQKKQHPPMHLLSDGDLVTVRDAVMTGQLDQYATEVGLWQGLFEKYGIDLKTTEFVAGINTIDYRSQRNMPNIGMMADYGSSQPSWKIRWMLQI